MDIWFYLESNRDAEATEALQRRKELVGKALLEQQWYTGAKIGYGDKPLILCIDMQKLFTEESSPLGGNMPGFPLVKRAIIALKRLIAAGRERDIQVVYTVVAFRKDKKDMGLWKVPHLGLATLGSKWVELCEELEQREEDILFVRKMPSAFWGTELLNTLIVNKFDTLILTGSNTSGCIRATTIASFMHGFRTIIPEDCVGDLTGEEPHWANLRDVNARYADVVSVEDVLDYFQRL